MTALAAAEQAQVAEIAARVEAITRDESEHNTLFGEGLRSDIQMPDDDWHRLEQLNKQANTFYTAAPSDIHTLLALVGTLAERVGGGGRVTERIERLTHSRMALNGSGYLHDKCSIGSRSVGWRTGGAQNVAACRRGRGNCAAGGDVMDAEQIAAIRARVVESDERRRYIESINTTGNYAEILRLSNQGRLEDIRTLLDALDEANAAKARTEHERDVAYVEFSGVYDAIEAFAVMTVETGVVPQAALDEFRAGCAVYLPLFEAAKARLAEAPKEAR